MAGKIKIDPKQVEALASRGLTREQVAHNLGIGVRTLQRRANEDPAFEEAYLRGKAKGITEIANALFKKAQEGNTTAQIFFLKCNGWKEASALEVKSSISGANGGPIEIKNTAALSNEQLLDIIHSYKDESK